MSSSEEVFFAKAEPIDELQSPPSACLEPFLLVDCQRVLLNPFDLDEFPIGELVPDPLLDFALHDWARAFPSSASLPADTFRGPSLNIFARDVE